MSVSIEINDTQVLAALQDLIRSMQDPEPALSLIGERLVESTKRRFETTSSPDNNEWAGNSRATIERKGYDWALKDTGTLADTIDWQLSGNELAIGSPMEYAAMQQFGGTKSEFPHLWGDIPARPFLGLSDEDSEQIVTILRDYLAEAI